MKLKPRHFAAVQYGILAIGLIAVWHTMMMPVDQAWDQLKYMFTEPNTTFSVCFSIATMGAFILLTAFCLRLTEKRRYAIFLGMISVALFALALWQFSQTLVIGFGTGAAMAVWVWKSSNSSFDTDGQSRRST